MYSTSFARASPGPPPAFLPLSFHLITFLRVRALDYSGGGLRVAIFEAKCSADANFGDFAEVSPEVWRDFEGWKWELRFCGEVWRFEKVGVEFLGEF